MTGRLSDNGDLPQHQRKGSQILCKKWITSCYSFARRSFKNIFCRDGVERRGTDNFQPTPSQQPSPDGLLFPSGEGVGSPQKVYYSVGHALPLDFWAVASEKLPRGTPAPAFKRLLQVCRGLAFEPHDIAAQLDERGRYDVSLEEEFPLLIKLFHYTSRQHTREATWHERLELFSPLDGKARFKTGGHLVELDCGDVLVVDNLKLHHVVDFPGFDTRVVVISFMPEFVFSLGSPSHDYTFLLPFYSRAGKASNILRREDDHADSVHRAMAELLECYFKAEPQLRQAGSKAYLLELLFHLARHFRAAELFKWEFLRQQERSTRLKPLFELLSRNYPDRVQIEEAARLVHMSKPQFMKTFKKVAGMTFVSYLNHIRLSQGIRLLRDTNRSIADIASQVGFADQSYFDRRFKAAFGQSPRQFRASAQGLSAKEMA